MLARPNLAAAQARPLPYGRANAEYQKLFTLADTDDDNRLSPDEARARLPRLLKDFAMLDADGDGQVSRSEYSAYVRTRYHRQGGRGK